MHRMRLWPLCRPGHRALPQLLRPALWRLFGSGGQVRQLVSVGSCYSKHAVVLSCGTLWAGAKLLDQTRLWPPLHASRSDSGFTLDKASGRCVACAEGCNACDEAGPGRCDQGSCDAGWGNVAGGTCVRCSAECLDCTSSTKCTNCDTGFGLWKDACQSCGAGCDACSFDGSGKPQCTSCGEGGLDAATKACVPCQQQHCVSW